MNIQTYPAFSDPMTEVGMGTSTPEMGSSTAAPSDIRDRVEEISDQAAMTEDPTMRANAARVSPVTDPPNHRTSP